MGYEENPFVGSYKLKTVQLNLRAKISGFAGRQPFKSDEQVFRYFHDE